MFPTSGTFSARPRDTAAELGCNLIRARRGALGRARHRMAIARMKLERIDFTKDRPGFALATLVTLVATGIGLIMAPHFDLANVVMVYLLGVAFVSSRSTTRAGVLASLLAVAAFDFCFVHPSGTFAVSDVQYVFTFGVMLAVSLVISTLTVRLREQSRASHDAALHAQVEQMRSDLLSGMSHDLRTPLAGIEGSAAAILEQRDTGESSRQLASTILEESTRMGRLIGNLLDLTRFQGRIDLNLDWYGLDELAANAILRTEPLFENPVELQLGPGDLLVRVDGVLIEQVFVNLLENAARHAGMAAKVSIAISAENGGFRIEVMDDGPGIASGEEVQIFERFHSTPGKGTGLGLAICRAAVEAHGGSIEAANAPSGGARFTITLNRSEAGHA